MNDLTPGTVVILKATNDLGTVRENHDGILKVKVTFGGIVQVTMHEVTRIG